MDILGGKPDQRAPIPPGGSVIKTDDRQPHKKTAPRELRGRRRIAGLTVPASPCRPQEISRR